MTLHRVGVATLLLVFVVCGFLSLRGDSATFDETAHLGAGVSYLETGDFRLNPEHPPLAKILAAAPLIVMARGGGDYRSSAWTAKAPDEWVFGFELINGPMGAASRRAPDLRLIPARTAMLALGAFLCLAIYGWAREMWGAPAGLLALALAVTCPTIFAHARLVTTDIPGALGIVATSWTFWRWTRRPTARRAIAVGGSLAAALLLKFNAVLLAPILVVLVALAVVVRRATAKQAASAVAVVAIVAVAGVWAGYGLRFTASPDPGFQMPRCIENHPQPSTPQMVLGLIHHLRLLPEAFVDGLAYARDEASGRTAFLDGKESDAGFLRYFPESFLFKTPPAFLLLSLWAIAAATRRAQGRSFDGWCLAIPPLILTAAAIVSRFNIGQRHIAFVYPFLCIATGSAGAWIADRGRRAWLVLALVAGCAVSFAMAACSPISYVNALGGGSEGGRRHFADSNVDWGQDLRRLKRWMGEHQVPEVDLAYFGTGDPRAYGIDFRKVLLFLDFYPGLPTTAPASGRVFAASVSLLNGLYTDTDRAFVLEVVRRGWVTRADAEMYLHERERWTMNGEAVVHTADWMIAQGRITAEQARSIMDGLPGGWLARARDHWRPIGRAGDSILIYRVE